LERRLYFLLNLATQVLRRRVDESALSRTGLTSAQLGVLQFLATNEGCKLAELARGVGVKQSAIGGLVERTERTGCIRTQRGQEDARSTQVYLSPKGRKLLTQMAELNRELNTQLRGDFSDAEIEVVLRFLNHVLQHFGS
jgi:MarR family transcriptional regulator, organic hydroperoxide resistance regulator